MDARQVLRQLIDGSASWSQNRLAAYIGLTSQAMGNRMSASRASSMRVAFVVDVLDALGYDLVAVPKGSRLPNGSMVIGAGEE